MDIKQFLDTSYTAYHAVENGKKMLDEKGFLELSFCDEWTLERNKGYYFSYNDSSLFAFRIGRGNAFMIAESHTDSPCLRVKGSDLADSPEGKLLNVEKYGGLILYSAFDIPLKIAGRIFVKSEKGLTKKLVASDYFVNIPSLAIHHNPDVNGGFAPSVQKDLLPLLGAVKDFSDVLDGENALDKDLYVVPAVSPFVSGVKGEFLSSPRIDNLTSVYTAIAAISDCAPDGIALACCFDNEEIGSGTRQGANSNLLETVLEKISRGLNLSNEEFSKAKSNGFILSADNAHATHQAHPEKSDPLTRVYMNRGIVIKHHSNYSTDGLSSAILKTILDKAGVEYQDYYNNSDVRCGGTIGLVSSSLTGMITVDVGLAQLSMHSAIETVGLSDVNKMTSCVKAVFESNLSFDGAEVSIS